MAEIAPNIACRMLCASACAYGIDGSGRYSASQPYSDAVGWDPAHPPVPIFAGPLKGQSSLEINACLIGKNVDGIVIAFRGTLPPEPLTPASLLDWLQDVFESEPEEEGSIPGKVHHGFWNAVETLWPELTGRLSEFQVWYPADKLYLTGHSKGGPMATISAARLHFDSPSLLQPGEAYTFASPRPGNSDFVAAFPLNIIPVTRYENCLDLVPFLAPGAEFFGLADKVPLLKYLFERARGWDYSPLGVLKYIEADHGVTDDRLGLTALRLGELAVTMLEGHSGEIAAAHSHLCGGGYMSGTCPTGVCL